MNPRTKQDILVYFANHCPFLNLRTYWSVDPDPDLSIFDIGCGLGGENPETWECFDTEVRASVIFEGNLVHGSAFMGGTWEKLENDPEENNPLISGYYPQMVWEALENLIKQLPEGEMSDYLKIALNGFSL